MTLKNTKGFTLVEMLVVIAIISVLAAALFPAISNALSTASATALKQKGRGIWVAITSANMEREPLNLGSVWPYEIETEESSVGDAVSYFNYLLSDGETTSKSTDDADLRVVADLTPDALIANGVPAIKAGDALTKDNIAWGVVRVGDSTPGEIPFLITRNFDGTTADLKQQTEKSSTPITLTEKKPFGKTRAVWVSRGGGTFDARPRYFTITQLMGQGECKDPEDNDTFTYWAE